MTRIAFWKFNEPADSVQPGDSIGSYDKLLVPATLSQPLVDFVGVTGISRVFTGTTGYTGAEAAGVDVLLNRSMTIQTLIEFDRSAQAAAGTPGVVASLGFRDSSPEDLQFSLELEPGPPGMARVALKWEEGGVLDGGGGKLFVLPSFGFVLLTVVRDWRAELIETVATSGPRLTPGVIVRYYANDTFLGREIVEASDIGGSAGATMVIGARGDGAGAYENHIEATVDQILVRDDPMTAEEVRQIYRRIAVHQPGGYETLKELLPEGVYSNDPESIVQRELFVEGQGVGATLSKAAEFREDFLPDRAWSFLDRWETVVGLSPGPGATILGRRNAILAHLRAVQGHSVPKIQDALAAPLDLDPSDVQILEFDNLLNDEFPTTFETFWDKEEGNGTITTGGGNVNIELLGGLDYTWSGTGFAGPVRLQTPIDGDPKNADPSLDAEISVLVDSSVVGAAGDYIMGILFIDAVNDNILAFGISSTALVWRKVESNVTSSEAILTGSPPSEPYFLNARFDGGTSYTFGTAPSSDRADVTEFAQVTTGIATPGIVGIGGIGFDPTGPSLVSLDFDSFQIYTPNGTRPFYWFAFRDPTLSGTPDLAGANRVISRIKPAHTIGGATFSDIAKTDDPFSLTDTTPIG